MQLYLPKLGSLHDPAISTFNFGWNREQLVAGDSCGWRDLPALEEVPGLQGSQRKGLVCGPKISAAEPAHNIRVRRVGIMPFVTVTVDFRHFGSPPHALSDVLLLGADGIGIDGGGGELSVAKPFLNEIEGDAGRDGRHTKAVTEPLRRGLYA